MRIRVNGRDQDVPDNVTVGQLAAQMDLAHGAFAIAVNLEFIPRSAHASTTLRPGDAVEIVAPQQGG